MAEYFDALCQAMASLARQPHAIFVGQGVGVAGTTMTDTLRDVPAEQLLEFPVAEDLQMGACIGMAIDGMLPVSIFPRWNFLLCAANQLVNHLDRLPRMSRDRYRPKVIIRVAVPDARKVNPGPQHDDDFTVAFRSMFRTVTIVCLKHHSQVEREYAQAIERDGSTLLVEYTELYGAIPSGVPVRSQSVTL